MTAARAECDFDVLIVGGGLVGASLACALARDMRVAVVEAVPFSTSSQPGYDDRSIALAYGTRRIFEGMGLWPALAAAATPIERIHVSDRGRFGAARLRAADYGYEALGYVVESRVLGGVLAAALQALPRVELICPGRVEAIEMTPEHARVTITAENRTRVLTARLLVGADGAESSVRRWAGIGALRTGYSQSAVIANVTPEHPHGNVAYERFTDSGPLALLPLSDRRCALVWTVGTEQCAALLALRDEEFLARLQARFGDRLGRLQRVGARAAYPLALVRARRYTAARLALIGNAAHTLHPIAGQGFNLGLRDVAALAEVVCDAAGNGTGNGAGKEAGGGHDAGAAAVLARYEEWRRHDQRHVVRVTDGLVRLFSNDHVPLAVARGAGLVLTDLLPPLKRALVRRATGLAGRQPRLARGLPL